VTKDIALFYFYSSPPMPDCCYLQMRPDISYRNLLLLPCEGKRLHFELPFFEDHSYNTICNRYGVMSVIRRPEANEKYIIFRTTNRETGVGYIIGYYRVGQAYYQESRVFNNNGFVWGFNASESHLIKLGALRFDIPRPGRGYRKSWDTTDRWPPILRRLQRQIRSKRNLASVYQRETNRLVALLKDERQVEEWRRHCDSCEAQLQCAVFQHYSRVGDDRSGCDMYAAISKVYNGTLYSRNLLSNSKRTLIHGGE